MSEHEQRSRNEGTQAGRRNNEPNASSAAEQAHSNPGDTDPEQLATNLQRTRQNNTDDEDIIDAELVTRGELRKYFHYWSGPTPSPDTLQAFRDIDPSFADRAFTMSERALEAHNEERLALAHGDIHTVKRGQYLSALIVTSCIVGSLVAVGVFDSEVLAGLILAPALMQFLGKLVRTVRDRDDTTDS